MYTRISTKLLLSYFVMNIPYENTIKFIVNMDLVFKDLLFALSFKF